MVKQDFPASGSLKSVFRLPARSRDYPPKPPPAENICPRLGGCGFQAA